MASGDNTIGIKSPRSTDIDATSTGLCANNLVLNENTTEKVECTPQTIHDNETKLKERVAQCKNIIDSLKLELNEEKSKFEKQRKTFVKPQENIARFSTPVHEISSTDMLTLDPLFSATMYSSCIDNNLNCDENLIEYEKQLQKYQNTLNLAQTEKKNAIRRQMLAKAYKLKLLEIENQCNVELLRVKQSLQCLEPLKLIANKWKSSSDSNHDYNSFDLISRCLELNANSGTDVNALKNLDTKIETREDCAQMSPQ